MGLDVQPPNDSNGTRRDGRVPRATYRLQFNHRFTFRDAAELVPYLADLGISDLYASPYLQARPGSLHGYDISNHGSLNPEVGGEEEHARMCAALAERGMGHLLDIVPNHMGIGEESNGWWMDVLEDGPTSQYALFFDIDWRPMKAELTGKVLLPVLGDQYGCVLERGELRLEYHEGSFRLRYFDHRFPVAPRSVAVVLREAVGELARGLGPEDPDRMELESVAASLEALPERVRADAEAVAARRREKAVARRRLGALREGSAQVRLAIERAVERFNGTADDARSFDALDALLSEQSYRLAFWRVAAEEINYRRFFDVNELAGLRVERPEVFRETHRLVLRLVAEGKVTGLRIDHPDGLFHPRAYLRRLQDEVARHGGGSPSYVLVEKILTGDEPLPEDWPVAGTVGYEYLVRLNSLFVAASGEKAMTDTYTRFVGREVDFHDLVARKKRLILRTALVSELTVLATLLSRISEANRCSRDFTWGALRDALREVIAAFPVYRTYVDAQAGAVGERDRQYVDRAVRIARRRNPNTSASIFDFVRDVLLLRWPDTLDPDAREEHASFVMKFQQLTGPVMAKGVEDTSFYLYNRLASLNEVGGEPERFGIAPEEMHRWLAERAARWPHALNATSTHDTKRSEDVRARIDVLSEIPDLWDQAALRWRELNAPLRPVPEEEDALPVPDANDEYLLYQTLVGAWPLGEADEEERTEFVARVQAYMEKATREAKARTSWINPDEDYDVGLREFVAAVLDPAVSPGFVEDLRRFQAPVARMGMLNSLSQTLVKLASPGVPDVYQGQELWDLSLVDPDNRRPVDYELRARMLEELRRELAEGDRRGLARDVYERWEDGRIKLWTTHGALLLRAALPGLFADGAYVPLLSGGERVGHLFAFARTHEDAAVVAVVPRLPATLTRERGFALPDAETWKGTWVEGPAEVLEGRWRNAYTGAEVTATARGALCALPADELFADFPVALLEKVG